MISVTKLPLALRELVIQAIFAVGRGVAWSNSSSRGADGPVAHAQANAAADHPGRPRVVDAQADTAAICHPITAAVAVAAALSAPSAAACGSSEPQQHAGGCAGAAAVSCGGDSRRLREQRAF